MIAAYLVGVTVVGSVLARRSVGGSGWAVADGRMGLLLVAVGVAGTRIGGVGTYGVAGDVVNQGLWSLWYAVNTLLALVRERPPDRQVPDQTNAIALGVVTAHCVGLGVRPANVDLDPPETVVGAFAIGLVGQKVLGPEFALDVGIDLVE